LAAGLLWTYDTAFHDTSLAEPASILAEYCLLENKRSYVLVWPIGPVPLHCTISQSMKLEPRYLWIQRQRFSLVPYAKQHRGRGEEVLLNDILYAIYNLPQMQLNGDDSTVHLRLRPGGPNIPPGTWAKCLRGPYSCTPRVHRTRALHVRSTNQLRK